MGCPPRVRRGAAAQAATASGVNHTVRLPRARRAASYSAQLVTRCRCFGMWWRQAALALNGTAGVQASGKEPPSYTARLPTPTGRSVQQAMAAVETTPQGQPVRLKLRRVRGFRRAEIAALATRNFAPASTVVSDGLRCFTGVGSAGCVHQPIITGSGRKAALRPAFKWVNTILGNIKSAITGTYRAVRGKHVPRYLAEFEYRFNRRYDLAVLIPRPGFVAVRTPPMPCRLLKLAENHT